MTSRRPTVSRSGPASLRARGPARVLLVAPTNSYRTYAYIEAARRLGVDLVLASEGRHALVGAEVAGVQVDLHDPQAVDRLVAQARQRPFAGVVATDDASVVLTSRVAQALGLPHNPPSAARLSRRKDLARAHLQASGLPVPVHWRIDLGAPLEPQLQALMYPCVIKPVALAGSRGVIRADDPRQAAGVCGRIRRILDREKPGDPEERRYLLAERFIPGPEVALEGLLKDGELQLLALFDKPDPLNGPFFEETYYISPSRLAPALQAHIRRRVAEACRAYGLREGPVHAEVRVWQDEAWIMEVASRTIGGECARLLRSGTGFGLEELVMARAMGEPLSLSAPEQAAGVLMIPIPKAGILRRVEGVLAARRVPGVEDLEISLREGYELVPLPEGSRYLGFIFARGADPEAVERALRAAHRELKVVVAPLWSLAPA